MTTIEALRYSHTILIRREGELRELRRETGEDYRTAIEYCREARVVIEKHIADLVQAA